MVAAVSAERLGFWLGVGGVLCLLGALATAAWVMPGVHGDRVDAAQALAAAEGIPVAPDPNFPGGLNGQAVGEKQDANRDLQKQIWIEMAEAAKRGEDPMSREVASELRDKLKRRGGGIKKNPRPDKPEPR